jgi:hypothetical protein
MKSNKAATMAPKRKGSGTKVVTGGASTVRVGSAKGKLPRTGNGGK